MLLVIVLYFFKYSFYVCVLVLYVLLSILCVLCFVFCIFSSHVFSYLFSICVQFYRPLPPGGSSIVLYKFRIISYPISSYHVSCIMNHVSWILYHASCIISYLIMYHIISYIIYHIIYKDSVRILLKTKYVTTRKSGLFVLFRDVICVECESHLKCNVWVKCTVP